jgi:hypothetical protein
MRTRTLLVPAPRVPRPAPSPTSAHRWLSPRESDLLTYVYEAQAYDTSAPDALPLEHAFIPTGGAALGSYYLARRLELVGLITLCTTTQPNAEDGYKPHAHPTHYAWEMRLTREGEKWVARHINRTLPRRPAYERPDFKARATA